MTEDELNAILAAHVGININAHWDTCHHDGNPRQHAGCAVSKLVAEVRRLKDLFDRACRECERAQELNRQLQDIIKGQQ
jgi:hypothetical protein